MAKTRRLLISRTYSQGYSEGTSEVTYKFTLLEQSEEDRIWSIESSVKTHLTVTIPDGIFQPKGRKYALAVVNATISEKFSQGPSLKFYSASFGDVHPNRK